LSCASVNDSEDTTSIHQPHPIPTWPMKPDAAGVAAPL
jgi:hypothetical protein